MKNQIAAFLATALVASMSFAQNTSSAQMPAPDYNSSKGFRVSIVKPMLEAKVKASGHGQSASDSGKLDEAIGFAVGYANLPVQALGWTANLTHLDVKNEGSSTTMLRVDGNAAYAFTDLVNVKGGLNLSKFTSSGGDDFSPAIGMQASVGFQVTKNFGIDLGYTQMNQKAEQQGFDIDLTVSGLEIGLNGTF
jgi:hypothetical protein